MKTKFVELIIWAVTIPISIFFLNGQPLFHPSGKDDDDEKHDLTTRNKLDND